MQITSESFDEWQHHPVTKGFFKALFNEREFMKEASVTGNFLAEERDKVDGRCAAIASILNMTYEELIESMREYDRK